ncbi:MAG: T9SS type A sorting domain-containing protein [Syntrophaceticus schinkii]|nr:T9SS type A sorting domain-containing protein [Syntrophaceticus schinkii]
MSGVLTVILWIAISGLFAQQPQIEISLANSLGIPHDYDHVIKLPSGDLQFYKMTTTNGSIQITGFQYLSQSNTLTEVVQIGNITGIEGTAFKEVFTQRFGKYYVIYQYPQYNPQGLVVIRLDAQDLEFRIIDNMQFSSDFMAWGRIDIVSENHLVIALEDRLEFYDFASGTSQTLLDGPDYQSSLYQLKRVYAMPTGHFMYVKDTRDNDALETWFIFNSQGIHQFTMKMLDPWFGLSMIGGSYGPDCDFVHDRFYIGTPGMAFDSAVLECHFPTPDSLHVFIVGQPVSVDEHLSRLVRFGDDRILRSYLDYGSHNGYFLYMNHSPLEDNLEPTHWTGFGPIEPHIDNINDQIVAISARYESYILVSALCTLDFPTSHTFTFPAPTVNVDLPVYTFSHEDQLFMISNGVLYAFTIYFSVSNADATAVPPLHTLSAYPNPVNLKGVITFKASLKQALELDIYNVKGQRVDTISLDSEGTAEWDLRNHKGAALSAGVYFAKPRNHKDIKPIKFIAIH